MTKLGSLVGMQLKDKVDLSWTKSVKTIIQKIVFGILKFAIVFAVVQGVLMVGKALGVFFYSESIRICILLITLMFILSVISCTVGITQSLYFDDDNKVLVTLPVSGSTLFLSKLCIFYITELKKALFFTFPIILSCFFYCGQYISIATYFWMIIPLLFYVALPVLLGAILSIPFMLLRRLFNRLPVLEIIFMLAIVALGVTGVVYLIKLIPEDINLLEQWGEYRKIIRDGLLLAETKMYPFAQFVYSLTGELNEAGVYRINWWSVLKVTILISSTLALLGLTMLVIKPIFFYMMTKNFEFDKKVFDKHPDNKVRPTWLTFMHKEFLMKFRDTSFYTNYVGVYIVVPILLLLLNKIFIAMSVDATGEMLGTFFNILLILLPLLASNSKISFEFTQEGRSAYIKKTKPVQLYWGLTCKFIYNIILVLPSIIACTAIMGKYTSLTVMNAILIGLGILFIEYAHMFLCARLDLMNPQNEQFATTGNDNSNPNENKATIYAFVLALLFSLMSLFFLNESYTNSNNYNVASVKLMLIGLVAFLSSLYLYLANIKAFYLEK